MKLRFLYVALIVALFAASSCNVINLNPVTGIGAESAITDSTTLAQASLGTYSAMQSGNYYGFRYTIYADVYADQAIHIGTFTTDQEVLRRNIQTANLQMASTWASLYAVIRNANYVIAAAPTVGVTATTRDRYISEARALRALAYFDFVRTFGGVPIVTTPLGSTDNVDALSALPRNTVAEVYNQIIGDLQFAITNLGSAFGTTGTTGRPFRLNNVACRALLAKVYLQRGLAGDAALAEAECNAVISSGLYTLQANYADVFGRKGNSESIFELNFTINDQNGISSGVNRAIAGQRFGSQVTFGTSFYNASLASPADRRFAASLRRVSGSRFDIVKYFRLTSSDDNVHIIRLADIFLLRAEARCRIDPPANAPAATVIDDVNRIRFRAGINIFTGGSVAFTTVLPQTSVAPPVDNTAMLAEIDAQRRFELAFEGHRFYDMKRFGTFGTLLNTDTGNPANPLWPVPLVEIQRSNGILLQNPGY